MAKFVFVFTGGAPEKGQEEENVKDWGAWIADLSSKGVYDSGVPFGWTRKVINSDNSVEELKSENSGYSLIEAESMDAAIETAKSGPNQKYGGKTEVYDIIDMSNMAESMKT